MLTRLRVPIAPWQLAAAVPVGFLVGSLVGSYPPVGVLLSLGLAYAALVTTNPAVGFAVWVGASLFEALGPAEPGVKALGVVMALALAAAVATRPQLIAALLRHQTRLVGAFVLLLVWILLSVSWSESPTFGVPLWNWGVAAVVFFVVATAIREVEHVRLVLITFVAAAAASVLLGVGGSLLGGALPSLDAAVNDASRLEGGLGDPNILGGVLVSGSVLAAGLVLTSSSRLARVATVMMMGLLVLGLVATQSRGGVVALLAAAAAAVLVFRGRRLGVLVLVGCVLGAGGLAVGTSPEALERLTTYDDGGTGRSDLWRVAWTMGQDHPVIGVGVGNFSVHSPRYVRELPSVERADLIAEAQRSSTRLTNRNPGLAAHNVYLQLFSETGIVGVGLFLLVVGGCLRACWLAAREFESLGEGRLGVLASAVMVAGVGALGAAAFIPNPADERLWVLLALGPALLGMSRRARLAARPGRLGLGPVTVPVPVAYARAHRPSTVVPPRFSG